MRRVVLAAGMMVSVWGCSGSGSGSNSGPTTLAVDQAALLFGLETGNAVSVGTQPANSLQIYNSGTGTITITSATVGPGATTVPEQLPLGDGGSSVMFTLNADNTHPEFFTASAPSTTSVSGTTAAVVQVIFNPTLPGVFTAALTIVTSAGTKTVALAGEAVTPLVSTLDGGLVFTVPTVTLAPAPGDDGGPLFFTDGGPEYATGYSSTIIPLYNIGSAELTFAAAQLDANADTEIWQLCRQVPGETTLCNPGPIPLNLPSEYDDGGIALTPSLDGGLEYFGADLKVLFSPAVVGTFTTTVTLNSNATNTPMLTLTINGAAVAP